MTHLKSHAIYDALRERILSNDIGPGTRLVMRDVANQYEASDIPVREALRMLERDGLVETAPYRGARVTTLTAKELGLSLSSRLLSVLRLSRRLYFRMALLPPESLVRRNGLSNRHR